MIQLFEYVVLRTESRAGLWRFEVERQPLLHPTEAGSFSQVTEQSEVQYQRGRENRIPAEEIDLDLHGIAQPAENIDIIPALFIIAMRGIIVDADLMI